MVGGIVVKIVYIIGGDLTYQTKQRKFENCWCKCLFCKISGMVGGIVVKIVLYYWWRSHLSDETNTILKLLV
ncbi:unnamed protein product [Schistosoma curassoni]|nr:unnamed protein product [Schistosoma curassoni]